MVDQTPCNITLELTPSRGQCAKNRENSGKPMPLEIRRCVDSELGTRETKVILDFLCDAFQYRLLHLSHAEYRFLAYVNDKLIAHCALVSRAIYINDTHYHAYFLGGMCTRKENRNSGVGGQLLTYVIESLGNQGKHLLILNCGQRVVPFYVRNGFIVIAEKAVYDRAGKEEIDEDPVLAYPLSGAFTIQELHTKQVYLGKDF